MLLINSEDSFLLFIIEFFFAFFALPKMFDSRNYKLLFSESSGDVRGKDSEQ